MPVGNTSTEHDHAIKCQLTSVIGNHITVIWCIEGYLRVETFHLFLSANVHIRYCAIYPCGWLPMEPSCPSGDNCLHVILGKPMSSFPLMRIHVLMHGLHPMDSHSFRTRCPRHRSHSCLYLVLNGHSICPMGSMIVSDVYLRLSDLIDGLVLRTSFLPSSSRPSST